MFHQVIYKSPEKALCLLIEAVRFDIKCLESAFNYVTESSDVDTMIYELRAAQCRLKKLMDVAKENNIGQNPFILKRNREIRKEAMWNNIT